MLKVAGYFYIDSTSMLHCLRSSNQLSNPLGLKIRDFMIRQYEAAT